MQAITPEPSTPTVSDRPESPLQKSFLGGSLFTSPPEDGGDLSTESRRRGSWWGGGKDTLLQRRASRTWKKPDKERQSSDKETPKEKPTKAQTEKLKDGSSGDKDKVEATETRMEVKNEGSGEEAKESATEHPGKAERDDPELEVVGKVEVVDCGPPAGKNKAGRVRMMEEQLKTEAEKTVGDDDTATLLKDSKSLPSLNSSKSTKGSRGSAKPGKKRWSLMIARKSTPEEIQIPGKQFTADVAGPRFEAKMEPEGERCAGDNPSIYVAGFVSSISSSYLHFVTPSTQDETNFIRERVSIRGVIRPLEPETELAALQLGAGVIGVISLPSLRRYIQGKAKYDTKFSGTIKSVCKERQRNLKLARKEGDKSLGHLESYLQKVTEKSDSGQDVLGSPRLQKVTAGSWNWSWALDEDEHPPPSSIVSRRDTWEARQLAMIADIMPENTLSGNNLWQHLVTFLTVTPDKKVKTQAEEEHPKPEVGEQVESDWTSARASPETNALAGAEEESTPLAQADGTVPRSKPFEFRSTNSRSRGWYWTRGSLWKEKFKANHSSTMHKRGPSSSSTVSPAARTPSVTLV